MTRGSETVTPFGQFLLAAGVTSTELAWRMDVSVSSVKKWRQGVRHPEELTARRLCKVLRLRRAELDALLGKNGEAR